MARRLYRGTSWCLLGLCAASLANAQETGGLVLSPAAPTKSAEVESLEPPASPLKPTIVREDKPVSARKSELIRQRFPNGKVNIERWVTESESGDLVNHGAYVALDADGQVVVSGEYQMGVQVGPWTRHLTAEQAVHLAGSVAKSFTAPFSSKATFDRGKLEGDWTCSDADGNLLFVWSFSHGLRSGASTWFNRQGKIIQTISYSRNLAHGEARLVLKKGAPVQEVTFERGRMPHRVDKWFPAEKGRRRAVQSRDWYLVPAAVNLASHDWNTNQVKYQKYDVADMVRHGPAITYFPNGQQESRGQYDYGKRQGQFTWWYANGQPKTEGTYRGDEEQGPWIWWHENGMKEASGSYLDGEKVASWSVWDTGGKLLQRTSASDRRVASRAGDGQSQ